MTTTPAPFRYLDEDDFCLSARLLPDLNTGRATNIVSITIEGSDDPQSVHVPVSDLPKVLRGIAGAAALAVARQTLGTTDQQIAAAPVDRAAMLREAADRLSMDWGGPDHADGMDDARQQLRRMADEAQQPAPAVADDQRTTADLLAASATEYRVPVPENGGTNLIARRQGAAFGTGWSVVVPGWGGGRAWTTEGWQESISALSVDRLFCWPDAATAVDEARRALATTEETGR
ncbi:hypothetical protein OHU11_30070 [Streptomyces sp. NBC_00257]|uniref:hypothetical protein n=1 Tax=unclassified Streptomyces TaxID=2593676 RepID=UPI002255C373|nr:MULTISPECIES: hypothetical protein [unclassified Streptomyces]MCX5431900.1 hypothetical protein [Streptomyces sp. NBC_00062]